MINQEMLNLLVESQKRIRYYSNDEIVGSTIVNDTSLCELDDKIVEFLKTVAIEYPDAIKIANDNYKKEYEDEE